MSDCPEMNGAALVTDLYQLAMIQSYVAENMTQAAVFELGFRKLPRERNFLLAAGLDDVLRYLERLAFAESDLAYLTSLRRFRPDFIAWLGHFRFTGDVWAIPEGTVVFPGEPAVQVVAPLPQGQFIESFMLNQVHYQTLVASKAARVVLAADGRPVIDFGLRRMHGAEAAMKVARASYIAGAAATSNVAAGRAFGIPLSGTMAHSFVEAHADESDAFRHFAQIYSPDTTLLIDTYDPLVAVDRVVRLAHDLGEDFTVGGVRLDSDNLGEVSKAVRRRLDDAGLGRIRIFGSGNLDEYEIARLLAAGAPIDAFGVGTRMGLSDDAAYLDCAYKLMEYAGRPRMKTCGSKATLPGRKQVFREAANGRFIRDRVGLFEERLPGRSLLVQVMHQGHRLPAGEQGLQEIRQRAQQEIASLPGKLKRLDQAAPPYPVEFSGQLLNLREHLREELLAGVR